MRAYFFGNMYLSSIAQGIQAGHVMAEMFIKYTESRAQVGYKSYQQHEMLHEWAKNHKTMILLNGGYGENLHNLYSFFSSEENPYPFAKFHEGQDALDGALTSVGIILPEEIYKIDAKTIPDLSLPNVEQLTAHFPEPFCSVIYSKWELELILRLSQFGLAR